MNLHPKLHREHVDGSEMAEPLFEAPSILSEGDVYQCCTRIFGHATELFTQDDEDDEDDEDDLIGTLQLSVLSVLGDVVWSRPVSHTNEAIIALWAAAADSAMVVGGSELTDYDSARTLWLKACQLSR